MQRVLLFKICILAPLIRILSRAMLQKKQVKVFTDEMEVLCDTLWQYEVCGLTKSLHGPIKTLQFCNENFCYKNKDETKIERPSYLLDWL